MYQHFRHTVFNNTCSDSVNYESKELFFISQAKMISLILFMVFCFGEFILIFFADKLFGTAKNKDVI